MATISEALALALDHHLAGRTVEADTLYGRILEVDADNADALHLHGVLCAQTGRLAQAVALLDRAVRRNPAIPDYHVNLGNAHRAAGQAGAAAAAYRQALALAPDRADAGFGLALALEAAGRAKDSLAAYQALFRHHPSHGEAWNSLALALGRMGRSRAALVVEPASPRALAALAGQCLQEGRSFVAERLCRRAARLRPDDPATHALLARLFRDRPSLAEAARRRTLALVPADAEAWNEQGLLNRRSARPAEAAGAFRRAVALRPDLGGGRSNLAIAWRDLGHPDAALSQARAAAMLEPGRADVLNNFALVLESLDRPADSAALMGHVLSLVPEDADAWAYRGAMLRRQGRIAAGLGACNRALALDPALAGGLLNRAVILQDLGRTEAGIADNRRLVRLFPDRAGLHSNLLLSLQYSEAIGPAALLAEHRAWEERHGRGQPDQGQPDQGQRRRHPNAPDPDRRLRVGYVSADFGYHPIGYFLAPLLPAHDRTAVEVFAYNTKPREDGMTRRLRAGTDHWRPLHGLDDAGAAAVIAADGIDILVDLAGHTGGNRLTLFVRKPAPVQVTWAGYVGTTGLSAMDALIACPRHMPPGSDATATERVVRLPDDYACVLPREHAPAVGPLPARGNGFVTFGCFNNRAKLSTGTLALWARLLRRVPDARLLLKTHQFDDAMVRADLLAAFAALGGDPARVDLSGSARHFDLPAWYNRVDVALDPFPYSGGLTTLEALWMGVPVVTLGGGDRFCARHSVAHLTAVGLPELVAADAEGYLDLAAGLAGDPAALSALRAGLRDRMAASPLCDGPRFARHLEAAYRDLWRGWCGGR